MSRRTGTAVKGISTVARRGDDAAGMRFGGTDRRCDDQYGA
ncbi:hypothetical protein [Natrinema amylolyticum]|nr:hypothetical protein [Natrinema amylolyticum]